MGKTLRRLIALALISVVTVAKPKSARFLTTIFEKSVSQQALVRQQDLVSKSKDDPEKWLPHGEGQLGSENTVIFKETRKFDEENLAEIALRNFSQKSCENKMTCAINNLSSFYYQQATI